MVLRAVADVNADPFEARPLVVIGCGNLNRTDDAVGVRVVQRLQSHFANRPTSDVRLFDAGTGGMDVMFKARGARELIIVDACSTGSDPGAIFKLPGSEIDTAHEPTYSLHDFRWDHAVHAGRRIFGADFPTALTVYLIEAGSLELGLDLTAAVAGAVDEVCEHIKRQIRGSPHSAPSIVA